jgi:hypothetical protein
MLDSQGLSRALTLLGAVLQQRGLSYDLVVAGGSALMLLGLLARPTRDLDVVALIRDGHYVRADPLPAGLVAAVRDVGATLDIGDQWLDPGPASLLDLGLPDGFEQRVETQRFGSLTLRLASRPDQICFKLYAATDQGPHSKHFADLKGLTPTHPELIAGARWACIQDPSESFRSELIGLLRTMGMTDVAAAL